MDNNENQQEFTPKENKAISTASWLYMLYMLFQSIYLVSNNSVDKVGGHLLYIFCGLTILLSAIVIAYLVLFFKDLVKIKKHRSRYIVITVFLVLMAVCFGFFSYDYAADIFVGPETVITDEYVVPRVSNTYISFIDNNGEDTILDINDEFVSELDKNPINQNESWSENYLIYHENTVTIEYYPNSHVIVDIKVNS